jgi:hypothetical protein
MGRTRGHRPGGFGVACVGYRVPQGPEAETLREEEKQHNEPFLFHEEAVAHDLPYGRHNLYAINRQEWSGDVEH